MNLFINNKYILDLKKNIIIIINAQIELWYWPASSVSKTGLRFTVTLTNIKWLLKVSK